MPVDFGFKINTIAWSKFVCKNLARIKGWEEINLLPVWRKAVDEGAQKLFFFTHIRAKAVSFWSLPFIIFRLLRLAHNSYKVLSPNKKPNSCAPRPLISLILLGSMAASTSSFFLFCSSYILSSIEFSMNNL